MPAEAAQLWAKDLPLDAAVHAFTVGEDPQTDLAWVAWDCRASAAHARMLAQVGLLAPQDAAALVAVLAELCAQAEAGQFTIAQAQEDGHTALEAALTARLGEPGKRIHLGRSRNDQVITAMRLWLRAQVVALGEGVLALASAFETFGRGHATAPLPGYTHLRRAMPSTFGQWAGAHAEGLSETLEALRALDHRLDRCPLGAAAGFGVPLPLDRELTASLLGFSRVQRNPMDVMNSRGRLEGSLLHWIADVAGVLEKALGDLCLYTTEEFGFLALPEAFTTGSSIMPQKRNPDVLELARGTCRALRGAAAAFDHLASGLPGSYHRDAQLQKAPLVAAVSQAQTLFGILAQVVPALRVQPSAAVAASDPALFAAHHAYLLVARGDTFRDAYRAVAREIQDGTFAPDPAALASGHLADAGALGLDALAADLADHRAWLDQRSFALVAIHTRVFDREFP